MISWVKTIDKQNSNEILAYLEIQVLMSRQSAMVL